MGGALEIFLEELDALGFDINLYTNLDDRLNDPYYIISEIDKTLRKDENCPCDFMTDIPSLCKLFIVSINKYLTGFFIMKVLQLRNISCMRFLK